jgi:oligopeptide transport system substrate-binding protein
MRIHKISYRTFPIILLAWLMLISGCSEQSDSPDADTPATDTGILHMGNGAEPQDLDPHIVTGVTEHNIISALLEGLVGKNPETLAPEPAVAVSWEIRDEGKTYLFRLRPEAKWSNNDPVTAHDFVYAWQRALMPALGNQYAYMLYPVLNAESFNKGQITDFSQVGIRAIDDHMLEVRLTAPTPYFLGLLDHYSTFPVHRATIEKFGQIDTRGSQWTRAGNFVGNGPFRLMSWEQNRVIVVEKNPAYWDAATVKLDAIHFHPVGQINTEERMFRAGQLHITYAMPEEKIPAYKKDNPAVLKSHPYLGTYFYRLNTTVPPLNDVRVRRALAMTIDREAIVNNVTRGGQIAAYTLTPPDTLGYTARAAIPYDVEQARRLLAEAGYPNGQGFPELTLLFNTLETHQKIAEAVQQMWKQALGINISLQNQEWKVYLESERTMSYQISRASWIGDYIDPNTFLDMFITDGGNNRSGWSSPQYDALIAQAALTPDQQARYELFQQAESILMNEVPLIPIYTYAKNYLLSPRVKGWYTNLMDYHPYKYVYLEPTAPD